MPKRRKLDPMNLGAGIDLKAINGEVEHAKGKDLMHTRIQHWEPRANVKRGCYFDVTSQGIKATKREKQAIINICRARCSDDDDAMPASPRASKPGS